MRVHAELRAGSKCKSFPWNVLLCVCGIFITRHSHLGAQINRLTRYKLMCGLAGIFGYLDAERTRVSIERMLQVQSHRGPDSSGSWYSTVQGMHVGLGFRRLKILDLSNAANQ